MKHLKQQAGLLGATVVLALSQVAVSQSTVSCPSTIVVQELPNLANAPGWSAHDNSVKGVHHFYGVAFSEGPPEKLVYQVPASSNKTKDSRVDVFDLTSTSEDVWISCLYRDTSQSLTQKLAKKFSRCEVTYDPRTGFKSVKKISCF